MISRITTAAIPAPVNATTRRCLMRATAVLHDPRLLVQPNALLWPSLSRGWYVAWVSRKSSAARTSTMLPSRSTNSTECLKRHALSRTKREQSTSMFATAEAAYKLVCRWQIADAPADAQTAMQDQLLLEDEFYGR